MSSACLVGISTLTYYVHSEQKGDSKYMFTGPFLPDPPAAQLEGGRRREASGE